MLFGEFNYRTEKKGSVPVLPRFGRELKNGAALTPRIEKYITAYPLTEGKKLAVCNFLVSLHRDASRLEGRQLDNQGESSRSRRF